MPISLPSTNEDVYSMFYLFSIEKFYIFIIWLYGRIYIPLLRRLFQKLQLRAVILAKA